ncbi:hypothetical protein RRG08_031395 [Elysia crispata]|uniref:Uncharacterized protein n=1 Tax=Elysia crispata TaxID=231223 RepID=A0AAE0ZP07_9GAST|nr:hypothetical protein RRG08_031395 [Elysia crispata]
MTEETLGERGQVTTKTAHQTRKIAAVKVTENTKRSVGDKPQAIDFLMSRVLQKSYIRLLYESCHGLCDSDDNRAHILPPPSDPISSQLSLKCHPCVLNRRLLWCGTVRRDQEVTGKRMKDVALQRNGKSADDKYWRVTHLLRQNQVK